MTSPALDPPESRKARGAFFTPPAIARFLVDWAVRSPSDRVLEPSCGDAVFLRAAAERIVSFPSDRSSAFLHGIELHGPSARTAAEALAPWPVSSRVESGDFFDFHPAHSYDAVVGNPPYVRFQDFSGERRVRSRRAALEAGVNLSGLASSWAAFVVHAGEMLAPGGRLALVLPAELLAVHYAAPVRRYLLDRFSDVSLVMFEQRVFPGVQEEVVLLLAEGSGTSDSILLSQVVDASGLAELARSAFTKRPVSGDLRWGGAPLEADADAAYAQGCELAGETLGDWGRAFLGGVSGANHFFALDSTDLKQHGLGNEDVVRLAPTATRHVRGVALTAARLAAADRAGGKTWLFRPGGKPGTAARDYISLGERTGVHRRYKCRVREPWWQVPLPRVGHLLLTYLNADAPRLVENAERVTHLNGLHGIELHHGRKTLGSELLPVVFPNSLTLLGCELIGRAYGGGLLKLEPGDVGRLPLPALELLRDHRLSLRGLRRELDRRITGGDWHGAVSLVDAELLSGMMGLDGATVSAIATARETLRSRRKARSAEPASP
ncbi:MAG: SAM-dependent DNA methyltransferase [Actinobacteria bacterium]|jgi:hypothetical protein|nr:SAM-dependent DNA methyltransferase [Actinomycetota bacterium]